MIANESCSIFVTLHMRKSTMYRIPCFWYILYCTCSFCKLSWKKMSSPMIITISTFVPDNLLIYPFSITQSPPLRFENFWKLEWALSLNPGSRKIFFGFYQSSLQIINILHIKFGFFIVPKLLISNYVLILKIPSIFDIKARRRRRFFRVFFKILYGFSKSPPSKIQKVGQEGGDWACYTQMALKNFLRTF